jgi:hypothetical protein
MKLKLPLMLLGALLSSFLHAGGTPEFVALPEAYNQQINYMTQNRVGKEQLAKIYTRENMLQAIASNQPVPEGSTIVMEIYASKKDRYENPIKGTGGNFLIDHLEGIQVMEYRSEWPPEMDKKERSGNWGFAMYSPEGKPMDNQQNCVACHWQLRRVNYMFTTVPMKNYILGR